VVASTNGGDDVDRLELPAGQAEPKKKRLLGRGRQLERGRGSNKEPNRKKTVSPTHRRGMGKQTMTIGHPKRARPRDKRRNSDRKKTLRAVQGTGRRVVAEGNNARKKEGHHVLGKAKEVRRPKRGKFYERRG